MMRLWALVGGMVLYAGVAAGAVPPLPMLPADPSLTTVEAPATSAAPIITPLKHVRGTAFDLRFVTVAQVVDLIYQDAMRTPYVLGPDVLNDMRLVSFRLDDQTRDVRAVMVDFLDSLGFRVTSKNGVDYVARKAPDSRARVDQEVFVYRPRYRSAESLRSLVEPVIGSRSMMPMSAIAATP
ncbi:type II secretory pathway protein, partial [Burkholderia thailandensis]|nr:type II secretory pathway protein [Burkholderia thailandensis]MCS6429239.1 type II secretory pathway protein [Burkholderia thailandensis]MCS6456902.1 type II secretory pathway protein [Burkholderia thailandensis]MCS6468238.1 type II secretory pathway protein [Burkholderia thailandensis]MCS6486619.1 type II secretory pathway protein [Burkholderia thailandensis]